MKTLPDANLTLEKIADELNISQKPFVARNQYRPQHELPRIHQQTTVEEPNRIWCIPILKTTPWSRSASRRDFL